MNGGRPCPAVVRPPALRAGDAVAIVSLSSPGPADLPAPFIRGLDALRQEGFEPHVMSHAQGRVQPWLSGTPAERAADVHRAIAGSNARMVLSTIGGNHSAQVLPLLDMDLIAANPTIVCGYSDITCVLHGIHAATGVVTFYGPALIPQWGAVGGPSTYVREHFRAVVSSNRPPGPVPTANGEVHDADFRRAERTGQRLRATPARPRLVLRGGEAVGPLLAGCLPSIRNVIGTPWCPEYGGRVLVLETPGPPYDLAAADADLTHLDQAGCLGELAALVLCRPYRFSPEDADRLADLVLDRVRGRSYPVVARFEGGHTDPIPTLPIGVASRLVAGDRVELVLEKPAVVAR